MSSLILLVLGVSTTLLAQSPLLSSEVVNTEAIQNHYRIERNQLNLTALKDRKIAVLADSSPAPHSSQLFDYLPLSSRFLGFKEEADTSPLRSRDFIAGRMAQMIWAMVGDKDHYPQFYFSNPSADRATRLQNFGKDLEECIKNNVDVIVGLQQFEGFGNLTGDGPLNRLVDQTKEAGILFVQSQGEYRGRVHRGSIETGKAPQLRIKVNSRSRVNVTLSWNSYSSGEGTGNGTDKDLDLSITDSAGKILKESKLVQVKRTNTPLTENQTKFPREELSVVLEKSAQPYLVKIPIMKGGFSPVSDLFQIVVTTDATPTLRVDPSGKSETIHPVEFLDANEGADIMVPADNPEVLTVGNRVPEAKPFELPSGKVKPDVMMGHPVSFTNGTILSGADVAAAQMAAHYIILKSQNPDRFYRRHMLRLVREHQRDKDWELPSDSKVKRVLGD